MGSVLTSAARREPIPGGSEPASLRATAAEVSTDPMPSISEEIAKLTKKRGGIWPFSIATTNGVIDAQRKRTLCLKDEAALWRL